MELAKPTSARTFSYEAVPQVSCNQPTKLRQNDQSVSPSGGSERRFRSASVTVEPSLQEGQWTRGSGTGRVQSRYNFSTPLAIKHRVAIPRGNVVKDNNKNFPLFWHLFDSISERFTRTGRVGPICFGPRRARLHRAGPGRESPRDRGSEPCWASENQRAPSTTLHLTKLG